MRQYSACRALCCPINKIHLLLGYPLPYACPVPRIRSGIRADPVHGVPPPSGVEGLPEHAAFDVPGTNNALAILYEVELCFLDIGGVNTSPDRIWRVNSRLVSSKCRNML